MQTINRILRVTGCAGTWCGELGKTAELPEIILGVCPVLRFDLRSSDKDKVSGALLPLPPDDVRSDAYCLVLDADYDQETPPKLLVSTDIALLATEDRTYIDARLPNTAIPALIQVLAKQKTVTLHGELAGYSKSNQNAGPADFAIQFELTVRNRVHLPGSEVPPEVVENPDYLTRVQILALIEAMTRPANPPTRSPSRLDLREPPTNGSPLWSVRKGKAVNPPTSWRSPPGFKERCLTGSPACAARPA